MRSQGRNGALCTINEIALTSYRRIYWNMYKAIRIRHGIPDIWDCDTYALLLLQKLTQLPLSRTATTGKDNFVLFQQIVDQPAIIAICPKLN